MFGANRANDRFWERTLENLATSLGVAHAGGRGAEGVRGQAAPVALRAKPAPQRGREHGRGHRDGTRPLGAPAAGRGLSARGPAGGASVTRRGRAGTASTPSWSVAGPNGLAAAIELARAGRSVRIYEAADTVGGGTRSAELTLPGFVHDVCSAAHPLGIASPFFRSLDLARHGLEWVQPEAPVAHALAPGRSVVLERDLSALAEALGRDADAWARLFGPLVREWERLVPALLAPDRPAAAPPDPDGPLRAAGPAAGDDPRPARVPRAGGAGPVRGHGRATRCCAWAGR